MGWDCTLHVFDPAVIETRLVPWLIGAGAVPEEIRDDLEDPDGVTGGVLEHLNDRERPHFGAIQLGLLALHLSSKRRRTISSRDFAVGLVSIKYDELATLITSELHRRFVGDVAPHFVPFFERWPHIAAAFPREFPDNYSTGAYIPAAAVGPAHRWLKREVAPLFMAGPMKKGYQSFVPSILRLTELLEHCAAEGLPYWEATDVIPVTEEPDLSAGDSG